MDDTHASTLDLAAIQRRIAARRQRDATEAKQRACNTPGDEPAGKLTQPADTCRHHDRRSCD